MSFTIDEILNLMDKLSQTGLGEVTVCDQDYTLKIKAKKPLCVQTSANTTSAIALPSSEATTVISSSDAVSTLTDTSSNAPVAQGNAIVSPIVGTFYSSPAPDKPNYVSVGSKVKKGDVLFIIESMKLMNEITSEYDGEIAQILVESGSGVEFSQPIMIIK